MSPSEHVDDAQLALRALGEPLSSAANDHLQRCLRCASEIDQYAGVVSTARSLTTDDALRTPSPVVWDAISDELQLECARDDGSTEATSPNPFPPIAAAVEPGAVVVSLSDRTRRWSTGILVAASMAGVLAGGALALGGSSLVDSDQPTAPIAAPSADVIGSTSLVSLPKHEGSGAAEIVQTPSGPELVVDVEQLSLGDGFYEVWLIDPKTFEMVGLGALNDDAGRFAIPDGLDLSKYTVVDVSLEPYDGDPVHSTDSVVRGEISA